MTSASKYGSGPYGFSSYSEQKIDAMSDGNGLTFVDFLPKVLVPRGFVRETTFENFRTLIDRANEWLRSNREWEIVTCESIEFTTRGDNIDYYKMTYYESGEMSTSYIRGLRLWMRERSNKDEREIQIGYVNLIPRKHEKKGIFKPATYETLDNLIDRFNSSLYSDPLPGRVITIETQEMKLSSYKNFDPDCSTWYEQGDFMKEFLFVIRIFYEIMPGFTEEIGVHDIVPAVTKQGGIFALPEYELFSNVVNRASQWCSQRQDLRFCNVQSVEMKLERGNEVNSMITNYTESGSMSTYYLRILRVAYTKPSTNQYSQYEKPFLFRHLTCRTFYPVQLTSGIFIPDFENLHQTRERVFAWIKATGADVLSAETSALRMYTGGERTYGTETTFTYNRSETSEYWIFVIRLYLNGAYREPPPEMLPPVPQLVETGCCVVL